MRSSAKSTTFFLGLLALALGVSACGKGQGEAASGQVIHSNAPQVEKGKSPAPASLIITNWGPQSTMAGKVFNVQPDGQAAFWVQVNQSLDGSDSSVTLDGTTLHSAISGSLITASVPAGFYAKPGVHVLRVVMKKGNGFMQSNEVSFEVQ